MSEEAMYFMTYLEMNNEECAELAEQSDEEMSPVLYALLALAED